MLVLDDRAGTFEYSVSTIIKGMVDMMNSLLKYCYVLLGILCLSGCTPSFVVKDFVPEKPFAKTVQIKVKIVGDQNEPYKYCYFGNKLLYEGYEKSLYQSISQAGQFKTICDDAELKLVVSPNIWKAFTGGGGGWTTPCGLSIWQLYDNDNNTKIFQAFVLSDEAHRFLYDPKNLYNNIRIGMNELDAFSSTNKYSQNNSLVFVFSEFEVNEVSVIDLDSSREYKSSMSVSGPQGHLFIFALEPGEYLLAGFRNISHYVNLGYEYISYNIDRKFNVSEAGKIYSLDCILNKDQFDFVSSGDLIVPIKSKE